jgi:DNA-binding transcriptional MerR regulator
MTPRLPDKIYFKIGEVSEILGVEPYVLRYWETEFDVLKPSKAPSRHRLYKKRDVELLLEIKRLQKTEGIQEGRKAPAQTSARRSEIQKRTREGQERTGVAAQVALLERSKFKVQGLSLSETGYPNA